MKLTRTGNQLLIINTMSEELSKTYDPKSTEQQANKIWLEGNYFHAEPDNNKQKPYTIVIPPPNVTAPLHLGHALNNTLQDILIRYHRMRGFNTLWMPGTDHAAISTNMKVEQLLAEQGISRHDLGREAFVERCWEWTRKYGGQIIEQLKALGCSYDWERTRFTLDDAYYDAVHTAFIRFHERGWLYLYYIGATVGTEFNKPAVAISRDGGETWAFRKVILEGFEGMRRSGRPGRADSPRPGREDNDAIRQEYGLLDGMRHHDHGLTAQLPDAQQLIAHRRLLLGDLLGQLAADHHGDDLAL
jgi:hypothetical protein